jgi:hypothetical protein
MKHLKFSPRPLFTEVRLSFFRANQAMSRVLTPTGNHTREPTMQELMQNQHSPVKRSTRMDIDENRTGVASWRKGQGFKACPSSLQLPKEAQELKKSCRGTTCFEKPRSQAQSRHVPALFVSRAFLPFGRALTRYQTSWTTTLI